jgi:hypothetical protein
MAYQRGWTITQFGEFLISRRRHPVKSGKFFCCVSFHLFPDSRDSQASVRQDTYVRTRSTDVRQLSVVQSRISYEHERRAYSRPSKSNTTTMTNTSPNPPLGP